MMLSETFTGKCVLVCVITLFVYVITLFLLQRLHPPMIRAAAAAHKVQPGDPGSRVATAI